MKSETINIIIPVPSKVLQPNCTIGSFGGRMMVAAARKRFRNLTREAIKQENIETMPWGKASVGAIFYHATKRRRDEDNATGSLKAVYDGIVDSGLVLDDDCEHMERNHPVFKNDPECPRVELIIERVK